MLSTGPPSPRGAHSGGGLVGSGAVPRTPQTGPSGREQFRRPEADRQGKRGLLALCSPGTLASVLLPLGAFFCPASSPGVSAPARASSPPGASLTSPAASRLCSTIPRALRLPPDWHRGCRDPQTPRGSGGAPFTPPPQAPPTPGPAARSAPQMRSRVPPATPHYSSASRGRPGFSDSALRDVLAR